MSQSTTRLEDYEDYVPEEVLQRIRAKAEDLRGLSVCHMNSTFHAGGVVEILLSLVGLKNQLGINTEWRLLRGTEPFYRVTREMHDALQNGPFRLTKEKAQIFERTFADNAVQNVLSHDAVYMHDHHTIGMVRHYRKRGPWIWRCHLDLSDPNPDLIEYLRPFAEAYSAGVVILESYKQSFNLPQRAILPAIDPTTEKGRTLTEEAIRERLGQYNIPMDRPIVAQISRFDRWKDPHGVVDAFEMARENVDATLVLLGNRPADDPEDNPLFDRLVERQNERIIVRDGSDSLLVSALQQHATVVMQKSLREGFGLTVSEAMWKGTPVIGGNAGGIPEQIEDGVNGFLVNSVEEAAERLVTLLENPEKAKTMGAAGREKVRERFLMTRLLEDHLDLLGGFEPAFKLS